MKKSYVYFLTNKNNSVIYIGVTTNLKKRIYEHKTKAIKGFTSKYNCEKLVYFEEYDSIKEAIIREKQLKAGNRKRKFLTHCKRSVLDKAKAVLSSPFFFSDKASPERKTSSKI